MIFSASLPGRDDAVLFDSLDGNGAIFYFCALLNFESLNGNIAIAIEPNHLNG